jgi:hypothetical protein
MRWSEIRPLIPTYLENTDAKETLSDHIGSCSGGRSEHCKLENTQLLIASLERKPVPTDLALKIRAALLSERSHALSDLRPVTVGLTAAALFCLVLFEPSVLFGNAVPPAKDLLKVGVVFVSVTALVSGIRLYLKMRTKLTQVKQEEHRREQKRQVPLLFSLHSASLLLNWFLPKKQSECLIGDLEEEYRTELLPKYGRTGAKFVLCGQVLVEIVSSVQLWRVAFLIKRVIGH